MPITTENTSFTRDVLGRYVCNDFAEAAATDFRRFNIIIVGGGSFGASLAEQLFQLDIRQKQHRILVLEGGPLLLPEHLQNLPPMHAGLGAPVATTVAELRTQWQQQNPNQPVPALLPPRNEVWGLAWHSRAVPSASDPKDKRYPGLAYCVGGRSLFWGGWSPELINSELTDWPAEVVSDLQGGDFADARRQLGTDVANDFIFGPLHDALRGRLAAGLGSVTNALPVASEGEFEAPLAVQSAPPRSGFFPFNKFSSVPLLMYAARQAQDEVRNDNSDYRKRLMVVPNCHVIKLHLDAGRRINRIQTNCGDIPVLPNSVVILALGTVESTRLALLSFPNGNGLIGKNLMAHLRSNTTVRIPRAAFTELPDELEASALFVKGRTRANGHFHLQITACGVRGDVRDSEAELNKKIPDLDDLDRIKAAITGIQDDYVVVTLRGIGEMTSDKTVTSASRVDLDPEPDEHGVNRAIVTMSLSPADQALWAAMDTAAVQAAQVLANGYPVEFLNGGAWQSTPPPANETRDGLRTTHHEGGTLWMGADPTRSVTDALGRFHEVSNALAVGPALFPSVGSPNPMLGGMALLRRTARGLVPADVRPAVESGFTPLFDGTAPTGWQMAGAGRFVHEQMTDAAGQPYGVLRSEGGLGLFWYTARTFQNFVLRLEYRLTRADDNSGVFVRFPNPGNDHWVAVNQGYEVQIDDFGRDNSGQPGNPLALTGGIYSFAAPRQLRSRLVGEWNEYEIRVQGQQYLVSLNGETVLDFTGIRSLAGHIGIQNHSASSRVLFRNIRIKELPVR
jgi:hypothetical protein